MAEGRLRLRSLVGTAEARRRVAAAVPWAEVPGAVGSGVVERCGAPRGMESGKGANMPSNHVSLESASAAFSLIKLCEKNEGGGEWK